VLDLFERDMSLELSSDKVKEGKKSGGKREM
jgi:hypothetical protein